MVKRERIQRGIKESPPLLLPGRIHDIGCRRGFGGRVWNKEHHKRGLLFVDHVFDEGLDGDGGADDHEDAGEEEDEPVEELDSA